MLREVHQCMKLLIGFGHPIKPRHIDQFSTQNQLSDHVIPSKIDSVISQFEEAKMYMITKLEEREL